jgi:hypothetical protein
MTSYWFSGLFYGVLPFFFIRSPPEGTWHFVYSTGAAPDILLLLLARLDCLLVIR